MEMPLVSKGCGNDCLDIVEQRDADLAILRAERLKEAEWLEKAIEKHPNFLRDAPMFYRQLLTHIASLKGDSEGVEVGTPASP